MTTKRPSPILDLIFGKSLVGAGLEKAMAERPPKWISTTIFVALVVWLGVLTAGYAGAQGWLPVRRELFSTEVLFWIAIGGGALAALGNLVDRYYQRRARAAARSEDTSRGAP
ncbi:hypothetical protein [Brevundimonas sp.]|uniref:hypothetical protein n=1 Tax=Brevundimonas sp. TaxID=1871086 RepID=UPI002FCC83AC